MTLLVVLLSSLKALDLVTMKKLDSKVNIIPVIAKADTITKTELQKFKTKVGPGFFTCYFPQHVPH
jgi:septin family protein